MSKMKGHFSRNTLFTLVSGTSSEEEQSEDEGNDDSSCQSKVSKGLYFIKYPWTFMY